jgi:uncharacterized protein
MRIEPRRRDRAMKDTREMEILLEQMPVGRLAVSTEDGPYVVAVNYLYLGGSIYFHSAPSGRKVDALKADPRVCFLVDEVGPQVSWEEGCGISQIYRSVVCFGRAELVEDPADKRRVLEEMVKKYVPSGYPFPSLKNQNIEKTLIVRIVIESMSGKANALSPVHTILPKRTPEAG